MNILLSEYNFNDSWIRAELTKRISEDSKVTIFPFSFSGEKIKDSADWDNAYSKEKGKYYPTIVFPFSDYGVKEENISWINYYADSSSEMVAKIRDSDILFLTGGCPIESMKRIHEKGLFNVIRDYRNMVIGVSAGALIQLTDYFLSPDNGSEEFGYHKGLGLIEPECFIEVHYAESKVQMECINAALRDHGKTVYAIKDTGGIIIDNHSIELLGDVITYTNTLL